MMKMKLIDLLVQVKTNLEYFFKMTFMGKKQKFLLKF